MEGKYSITLETPMGEEKGILELKVNGDNASGTIIAKNKKNPFTGGQIKGSKLTFSGKLKIAFMTFAYTADCVIENGVLKGTVSTKHGGFKVKGNKI
ncbi:hypothetical protein [Desnuesiella massiliensis]|uniref:hypothetical protein n=1 Tax=Desnuesiella massiliensis TaxID=1650662 RepID=UPI0006E3C325|nr:hypothetical protein [Desnuesiella massiliensis]